LSQPISKPRASLSGGMFILGVEIEDADSVKTDRPEKKGLFHRIDEPAVFLFKILQIGNLGKEQIDGNIAFFPDHHGQAGNPAIGNGIAQNFGDERGRDLCRVKAREFEMISLGKHGIRLSHLSACPNGGWRENVSAPIWQRADIFRSPARIKGA
jgi:hypothetical protein